MCKSSEEEAFILTKVNPAIIQEVCLQNTIAYNKGLLPTKVSKCPMTCCNLPLSSSLAAGAKSIPAMVWRHLVEVTIWI